MVRKQKKEKEKLEHKAFYISSLVGIGCLMTAAYLIPLDKTTTYGNKKRFRTEGIAWIKKAECGSCKQICHKDKNDKFGGFTCIGVSIKHNSAFYAEILNNLYKHCVSHPLKIVSTRCTTKGLNVAFEEFYYKNYFKPYENCKFEVAMHLMDTAILSGVRKSTRIFQRSHKLEADGIFGKISNSVCNGAWDKEKFIKERLDTLRKSKVSKIYLKGWKKRMDRLSKLY